MRWSKGRTFPTRFFLGQETIKKAQKISDLWPVSFLYSPHLRARRNRHEPPTRVGLGPPDGHGVGDPLCVLGAVRVAQLVAALLGQRVVEVGEGVGLPQHGRVVGVCGGGAAA